MWHTPLEEDTGKCLHRTSSAEVSHFVRTATLSSHLIMCRTLFWRVTLNEINAENETKPEMIAWQWHNTSAHFRTCYKVKVHLSLFQLASLYYKCFWCTCKSLEMAAEGTFYFCCWIFINMFEFTILLSLSFLYLFNLLLWLFRQRLLPVFMFLNLPMLAWIIWV